MPYLGVPPFGQTVRTITELTATAGQTTFTPSGGYLPGYIDVFLNGVSLNYSDFTASNGSTVVLTSAAALDDELKTIAYFPVSLTDTYRKGEVDAGFVSKDSATGAALMPVGTTAQRPASPASGMIRQNSTTGFPEWYDATVPAWKPFSDATYQVEYLVVAGGGGGGNGDGSSFGGGGGAGGYRSSVVGALSGRGSSAESVMTVAGNIQYSATVGAGAPPGNTGGNSVFGAVTSLGGGGGGNTGGTSGSGGAGGGRPWVGTRGFGTAGQGFDGSNSNSGGGGGGGGGAGSESTTTAGGLGLASSITGSSVTRSTGGGSGSEGASTVNSGNGGNSQNSNRLGVAGGSGIVIIRYAGAQRGTGGTVTSSGGYTIHTFTSSGTFTA